MNKLSEEKAEVEYSLKENNSKAKLARKRNAF
jgi:hypothetical protein